MEDSQENYGNFIEKVMEKTNTKMPLKVDDSTIDNLIKGVVGLCGVYGNQIWQLIYVPFDPGGY